MYSTFISLLPFPSPPPPPPFFSPSLPPPPPPFSLLPSLLLLELLTVNPPEDQFVAFNSADNVTYTCTVPDSRSVVWEFRGSQIRSQTQFQALTNLGVIIEPANTMSQNSTITISQSAREMYNDITIQCFSDEIGGISSVGGEVYNVITVCKLTVTSTFCTCQCFIRNCYFYKINR